MVPSTQNDFYYDANALSSAKRQARNGQQGERQALEAAAKQFEGIFTSMMLKGMRSASLSEGMFDSQQMKTYQEMFDKQLSVHLSESGGMGLAENLVRQIMPMTQQGQMGANQGALSNPQTESQLGDRVKQGGRHSLNQSPVKFMAISEDRAHPKWLALSNMSATEKMALKKIDAPATINPADSRDIQIEVVPNIIREHSDNMVFKENLDSIRTKMPHVGTDGRWNNPEEFIQDLIPDAEKYAKELGVDPRVLIAQSALETGWGSRIPDHKSGQASFNLFGIKADKSWQGESTNSSTLEMRNGQMQREVAKFRAYDSPADSMRDYVDFIQSNPRYQKALNQSSDPKAYLNELQRAGYATDPEYAQKIINIIDKNLFTERYSEFKNLSDQPLFT